MEQLDLFESLEVQVKEGERTRVCNRCNVEKPFAMFREQKNGMIKKNGEYNRHHTCNDCFKKDLKVVYELAKVHKCNQTTCDCCGKESETPLHLDHDHKTGKFRGWLCIKCNQGIGKLGDNIEGVTNALKFLEKHYKSKRPH